MKNLKIKFGSRIDTFYHASKNFIAHRKKKCISKKIVLSGYRILRPGFFFFFFFFFFFVARIFGAKWLSKPKSAWNSRVRYEFWEKFIASIWFLKFCSRKKFDLASIAIIKSMGKAGAQRGVRSKNVKNLKFFKIFRNFFLVSKWYKII